jgi:hypothetical protein
MQKYLIAAIRSIAHHYALIAFLNHAYPLGVLRVVITTYNAASQAR